MALLLTGSIGIASEGGEFSELLRNVVPGKPMMTLNFTLKENLAILCGIGLMLVERWTDQRCNC